MSYYSIGLLNKLNAMLSAASALLFVVVLYSLLFIAFVKMTKDNELCGFASRFIENNKKIIKIIVCLAIILCAIRFFVPIHILYYFK